MKLSMFMAMLAGLLVLSACEEPKSEIYPISGETCAPDDPVHDLRADCLPPV